MLVESRSRIFYGIVLGACTFLPAGCVHPLGPGYQFADRQAEILVSRAAPGRIHFQVADELENAGDRPLRSLEVRLPEGPVFGEQNLRVLIEGAEVSPRHSSQTDVRMMRAPFDSPWQQNEKRKVVTEWDLAPESSARGTIVASPVGFFIADETALPLWQTPNGIFARGGTNPDKELLTVFTPPDFRVLAPGKALKRTPDGNYVVQRFLINPDNDFLPYVVAGRYQEKVIQLRQGEVQFWTFRPMDAPAAQTAAERLSSSMKTLTEFLGPASKEKGALRIAEAPAELPAEFSAPGDPGGASFPEGVLLDPRAFAQGIANEAVLQLAEYELARTWFGWRVRPRPEAQILMGRGAGLFGLVIAAEGRGQGERRGMVASLMDRYDEARATAPDKRLMEQPAGYSRAERISTGYRAALFFVALEDICGHDNLRTAFRDIIRARAGSDTGYEELRAAAESASGKDLAEMFRAWLVQPSIPEDFRARYQKASSARIGN
ncbi:MAG TPA: hypothetical protein VN792_02245 [Candidatus Acidoferrales bacterium]|nr:hypothetical protein [Candidatus Acidoferrales bacterium]